MSAEDRAAQPLTPDMVEAVIRVARETAREEVRAAMDAQVVTGATNVLATKYGPVAIDFTPAGSWTWAVPALADADAHYAQHGTIEGFKPKRSYLDARSAAQRSRDYEVPETVAGVPV